MSIEVLRCHGVGAGFVRQSRGLHNCKLPALNKPLANPTAPLLQYPSSHHTSISFLYGVSIGDGGVVLSCCAEFHHCRSILPEMYSLTQTQTPCHTNIANPKNKIQYQTLEISTKLSDVIKINRWWESCLQELRKDSRHHRPTATCANHKLKPNKNTKTNSQKQPQTQTYLFLFDNFSADAVHGFACC